MTRSGTAPEHDESYYRQLCEHVGVALIATDTDLNIRSWNAEAARMFGAAAERMIHTPIVSILPAERREEAEQLLTQAMHSRDTYEFEFQYGDAKGQQREASGTIGPLVTDSGACLGALLCARDITRRIALVEALEESKKMASLGELAGAISHHFNNILGGVITSNDFAASSHDPELMSRTLTQTNRALQRATRLLNGLRAFAEGDQRSEDLADFTEILMEAAEEAERAGTARNVKVEYRSPRLPVHPVARFPLLTIMRNIMQNALEAMPNGGLLTIDVALHEDRIETRILDNGRGLDASALSRVFEPFWTTKNTADSPRGEASGLGLAIAHGLVQMLGGSITVSSKLGKGSCFCVTLPCRPE